MQLLVRMNTDYVVLLIMFWLHRCSASLNFYMSSEETLQLIDYEAEVQYVYKGNLLQSAIDATVIIPTHVNQHNLVWYNYGYDQPQILYSIEVINKEPEGLQTPVFNVSHTGTVPQTEQVISVELMCTGLKSLVEVQFTFEFIQMGLNERGDKNTIQLLRVKQCELFNSQRIGSDGADTNKAGYTIVEPGDINPKSLDVTSGVAAHPKPTSTEIFYVSVGTASTVIIIIAVSICLLYVRTKRHVMTTSVCENDDEPEEIPQTNQRPSVIGSSNHGSSLIQQCESSVKDSSTVAGELNQHHHHRNDDTVVSRRDLLLGYFNTSTISISRRSISLERCFISGKYSKIHYGVVCVQNEREESHEQRVIIKTITDSASDSDIDNLYNDASLLRGLTHQFLHPIIAINTDIQPLLIYPYCDRGNLKHLLTSSHHAPLDTRQLVLMAIQIGKAIHFIHRRQIIHKDVATRNCYVDGDMSVKLSDAALSRDLFPHDYQHFISPPASIHHISDNMTHSQLTSDHDINSSVAAVGNADSVIGAAAFSTCVSEPQSRAPLFSLAGRLTGRGLPIRWMSIESLSDNVYTTSTDVWMYGVLLWELITGATTPYSDVEPAEMLTYLQSGYRLLQVTRCPDELFAIMAYTWAVNPSDRPTLSQIIACLSEFHKTLARFI